MTFNVICIILSLVLYVVKLTVVAGNLVCVVAIFGSGNICSEKRTTDGCTGVMALNGHSEYEIAPSEKKRVKTSLRSLRLPPFAHFGRRFPPLA